MSSLQVWMILLLIGLCTFLLRLSFIQLQDRVHLPVPLQRALRYVPPAMLAALVVPALLRPEGMVDLSLGNERLVAGILAAAVAWLSGNVSFAMMVGMGGLWLLQWLVP
ncbi:MAG: AzlD domain-containing protein [Candidatus Competibacterales bacterium]|nr:AzlD domain-containing protein [Candidatus Competibacterales bacterium]